MAEGALRVLSISDAPGGSLNAGFGKEGNSSAHGNFYRCIYAAKNSEISEKCSGRPPGETRRGNLAVAATLGNFRLRRASPGFDPRLSRKQLQ
jgi:hypothetical protein